MEVIAGRGLYQIYPGGVLANEDVNLSVEKGEIHALVGENGAGKSTLMKMLYGEIAPTKGKILVKGEEVEFHSSKEAMEKGIGMVHQHFMQIPSMTVAENLVLGTGKSLFVDRKKAVEECKTLSEKYGLQVEAEKKVSDISIAMRQKLEILKALYRGAEIFILDEPTAVLTPQETEELFVQLRSLREKGHTILFISHKLQEVKALCDRMTILRDGKTMGTYGVESLSEADISRLMVGREIRLDIEKEPYSREKRYFPEKTFLCRAREERRFYKISPSPFPREKFWGLPVLTETDKMSFVRSWWERFRQRAQSFCSFPGTFLHFPYRSGRTWGFPMCRRIASSMAPRPSLAWRKMPFPVAIGRRRFFPSGF